MSNFRFEAWPTEFKLITQHFGARPDYYAQFGLPGHEGIDFQAPTGTQVFCVAAGTVRHVFADNGQHPYGLHIRIEHSDGYETIYAHLQEARVVEGEPVAASQLLGLADSTGNVDGAHLHLTLKHHGGAEASGYPNDIIDPTPFLMPLIDPLWDDATYVRDTIPDGTVIAAGQSFVETWFLRNSGGSTWQNGYTLRSTAGEALDAPQNIPLPPIPPGAEAPITLNLRAPAVAGHYRTTWQPSNADGHLFGDPIWVEIEVPAIQGSQAVASDFVQVQGAEFMRQGQPFRFFGVNLRGLAHYGRRAADPLRFSRLEHRQSQLAAAHDLGARVVRLFLADRDASFDELQHRLGELLEIVKQQFPDLYLLPVFTNFYGDVPFHVPGDDEFFGATTTGNNLLTKAFFVDGYRRNYLPFVQQIVTAFRDEPNIFAWEIGNELKLDRGNLADGNDPNPRLFIAFNLEVAAAIKRWDRNHLVTTGMKSTHHAWLHTPALQDALYTSPNLDFITIHSYEGMWDQEGDRRVYDDAPLAVHLGKPFLVEEAGFDHQLFSGRISKSREHMDKWFGLGARGYMPWGFVRDRETGDGDNSVGFGANLADFEALCNLFRDYAQRVAASSRDLVPAHDLQPVPAAQTRSLVGFDFQGYNQGYLRLQGADAANDAARYDVYIAPSDVPVGQAYWKAIGVHHLTPAENTGKHNVFIDILDENGQRVHDPSLTLQWGWAGQHADEASPPVAFDKGVDEPATNVPLESGQHLWIRVGGGLPSDTVGELHTNHMDEVGPSGETWNSVGHHSYYVVFQRTLKTAIPVLSGGGTVGVGVGEPAKPAGGPNGAGPAVTTGTIPVTRPPVVTQSPGRVRASTKLGIDANAPINPGNGAIQAQVSDPNILAETGAGWVRLNFILGQPWSSPTDPARPQGLTWEETYRRIIEGFRQRDVRLYGLIGAEAVHEGVGDRFRKAPTNDPLQDNWVQQYANNFATIVRMFRDQIEIFESFNEPDNWNGQEINWIHPGWFAAMLEAIYQAVRSDPDNARVKLISGPVQGLQQGNGAREYLDRTYAEGTARIGWGSNGKLFPFDGVGYHLYVHEGFTSDSTAQAHALAGTYGSYLGEMREVIRRKEGKEKKLYLSETGWFTNGNNREAMEQFQAESLRAGLSLLLAEPAVALVINFCTQDFGPAEGNKFYGLYRPGALTPENRKPAFSAFQQVCAQMIEAPEESVAMDNAAYVPDHDAFPDGTVMQPGQSFAQSWRMRNTGNTTWAIGYKIVWVGGNSLGAQAQTPVPACAPGQEVTITVPFVAPQESGQYKSSWQLCNAQDQPFGDPVWTMIEVATAVPAAPAGLVAPTARDLFPAPAQPGQLPFPIPQTDGQSAMQMDPEMYDAWRKHIEQGFINNQTMFSQVLQGFMNPYWTTVQLYRVLFGLGVASFVAAVAISFWTQREGFAVVFGGLSAITLLAYFFNRPLQALEENLQFITWLGIIYNTYWTRLAYTSNLTTVQQEVEADTKDTIDKIQVMMDKHAERSGSRPGLR